MKIGLKITFFRKKKIRYFWVNFQTQCGHRFVVPLVVKSISRQKKQKTRYIILRDVRSAHR